MASKKCAEETSARGGVGRPTEAGGVRKEGEELGGELSSEESNETVELPENITCGREEGVAEESEK